MSRSRQTKENLASRTKWSQNSNSIPEPNICNKQLNHCRLKRQTQTVMTHIRLIGSSVLFVTTAARTTTITTTTSTIQQRIINDNNNNCETHSACVTSHFCNKENTCSPCQDIYGLICDTEGVAKDFLFDAPIDGECFPTCGGGPSPTNPPIGVDVDVDVGDVSTTTGTNDDDDNTAPVRNVANPSFEQAGSWSGLGTRGSSELFAPIDGVTFAQLEAGSDDGDGSSSTSNTSSRITQNLGVLAANTKYTLSVWTRSVNAHIPAATGVDKGVQLNHPNLLTTAKIAARVRRQDSSSTGSDFELAAAEIIVSPNATAVANNGSNEHDDGGNVFFSGEYRMHVGNSLLYQKQQRSNDNDTDNDTNNDPITDEWQQGNENEYWGMAVAPISDINGNLIINAIGGGHTRTDLTDEQKAMGMRVSSRIEINILEGIAPDFTAPPPNNWDMNDQPIFQTVLSHLDDESPWVFDPHYCYDNNTDRLWMTWGGHSTFITEVDTITGNVIDPATGSAPTTGTEFNTHVAGVHTKILTNEPWKGLDLYNSKLEAPEDWEGDAFSTQAYMEGMALFQYDSFFFACGTYGSMGDSYTIRCCRQSSLEDSAPRGPYVDKDGKVCVEFDNDDDVNRYPASMLLGPDGDHLVPGHPHVWREYENSQERYYLGYDFRDRVPSRKEDSMAIRRLYFDDDGWPTIWMPLEVTIDTALLEPEMVGRQLIVELSAGGEEGGKVAFDHVSLSIVMSGGGSGGDDGLITSAAFGCLSWSSVIMGTTIVCVLMGYL